MKKRTTSLDLFAPYRTEINFPHMEYFSIEVENIISQLEKLNPEDVRWYQPNENVLPRVATRKSPERLLWPEGVACSRDENNNAVVEVEYLIRNNRFRWRSLPEEIRLSKNRGKEYVPLIKLDGSPWRWRWGKWR